MQHVTLDQSPLELSGLPWYEHDGKKLWRFPKELQGQISADLWQCSLSTSGGRIRFASDTTTLGVAADYSPYNPQEPMQNMCRIGQAGIDAYVDGVYWAGVAPREEAELEATFFEGVPKQMRQFTLHLPLYHHVAVKHLILDDDAKLLPPAPFAVSKPVVFYGTSITQGGCASRAGLSYQGMLCRDLNLDFVNLGFSGLGRGEAVVARAMAEIDASCYVLEFGQNNATCAEFAEVFAPFLSILRTARPKLPIVLATPLYRSAASWNAAVAADTEARREVVRQAYHAAIAAGDTRLYLVEGEDRISPADGAGLVDGVHPNDLGFLLMAESMKPVLRRVLGLY